MRKVLGLILLAGVVLFSACAGREDRLVTPHPEKITFIFFFTEG